MFIKRWAKFHNINSAQFNTLSSYALTLMAIHYLQYGVKGPAVVPALQQICPVSSFLFIEIVLIGRFVSNEHH